MNTCKCGRTIKDFLNPNYPKVRECTYCHLLCGVCKNIAIIIQETKNVNREKNIRVCRQS